MTLEEILKEINKDLIEKKSPQGIIKRAYLKGVITALQICRKKYKENTLIHNDLSEELMFYQGELSELKKKHE